MASDLLGMTQYVNVTDTHTDTHRHTDTHTHTHRHTDTHTHTQTHTDTHTDTHTHTHRMPCEDEAEIEPM